MNLLPVSRANLSSSEHGASSTDITPLPWQGQQKDEGPPGRSAPSRYHLCRSQGLHCQVFPHFSTCVHSATPLSAVLGCSGVSRTFVFLVDFPADSQQSQVDLSQKDKSCSMGDSKMSWGVHGGAGAEGSEPASCRCLRCPGHSTCSRQPHVPPP